jgi:hypothetical protein
MSEEKKEEEKSSDNEIKDFERYQALSDVIDSTFGSSSTGKSASYSVKMKVVGDERMEVVYTSVGNFIAKGDQGSAQIKRKFHDEGKEVIKQALEKVKEEYKDVTDKKISFKVDSESDDISLLQGSYQNPKRTCLYRLMCLVKVK